MFGRSFNSAKCKTLLRLAISRIKLLRNKREIQLKQMKRELVQLLQTNQEASARIRVEHIFREQNIVAAYDIIELFCELLVVRLPIIESQRQCPIDLKEAVASIIFAAPRCADLAELLQVREFFGVKYGKEFVAAAAELRPDCCVNRLVIEKLSIRPPSGEVKLKLMKDIATELNADWDPTASESELLKAPEDLLEGSTKFLAATRMQQNQEYSTGSPKSVSSQIVGEVSDRQYISTDSTPVENRSPSGPVQKFRQDSLSGVPIIDHNGQQVPQDSSIRQSRFNHNDRRDSSSWPTTSDHNVQQNSHSISPAEEDDDDSHNDEEEEDTEQVTYTKQTLNNVAAAAQAAAKSAERAAAAARAAALLANKHFDRNTSGITSDYIGDDDDDDSQEANTRTRAVLGPTHKKGESAERSGTKYESSSSSWLDEDKVATSMHEMRQRKQNSSRGDDDSYSREIQERESEEKGANILRRDMYSSRYESGDWRFDNDDLWQSNRPPSYVDNRSNDSYENRETAAREPSSEARQPSFPHVHPNLPDYDILAAQFHRLKSRR